MCQPFRPIFIEENLTCRDSRRDRKNLNS